MTRNNWIRPDATAPNSHLEQMSQLETLALTSTQLTDAAVPHLLKLANLEILKLNLTKLSDHGLLSLEGLSKLNYLELYGTRVTLGGLAKFTDERPGVEVVITKKF